MTQLIKSENEVRSFLNTEEFVRSTVLQLNKDLGGISEHEVIHDPTDLNPLNSLQTQMTAIFLSIRQVERIAQFIYRVDLNERDFRTVLNDEDWQQLSFLVIRREAQKVFLRHHFK